MRLLDDQGKLFGRISLIDLGLMIFLLLLTVPAVYFGWEIFTAIPRISGVEPIETTVTADQDVPLVIYGKWFDKNSVARLGDTPLITTAATPRRLEVLILTQKVYPGAYPLTVTNLRGLSNKWKQPVQLNSVSPQIDDVQPRRFEVGKELRVRIRGTNFQSRSSVQIETWKLNMNYISPTEIEARGIIPANMKPGDYRVRVTNYYGQEDQSDVITLFRASAPPPSLPKEPPPKPLEPTESFAIQVLCAFQEPEMKIKRKMLKPGAVMYLEDNTRPSAKIRNILGRAPIEDSDRQMILATLVLVCTPDPEAGERTFVYGRGLRGYPPMGIAVQTGSRLSFQFHALDIEGTVLSDPIVLKGKPEKYL